jgi:hypothetical protein
VATSVTETVDVELIDGTKITLRPLPVKALRKVFTKFGEYTSEAQAAAEKAQEDNTVPDFDPNGTVLLDNLIECATLALEGYKVTLEDPEDVLDIETIYKILKVGADIDLKSAQNLQREALGLTATG